MIQIDLPAALVPVHRPAALGRRLAGAFLDGLACATILVLVGLTWTFHTKVDTTNTPAPGYVVAIALGLVWLYLTWAGARGATLGMRALRLRAHGPNGSRPGPVRMAVRSLALVGAGWVLIQISLWLLLAYVVVAALGATHRMIHDLIAGTAVVDDRPPAMVSAGGTSSVPAGLAPAHAAGLLEQMEYLQRRSRADLHLSSVPLVVLGLLAFAGSAAELASDGSLFWISWLYWVFAAPLGLAVTAWWYHRLRVRNGVGAGETDIVVTALLVLCVSVLGAFLPTGGLIAGIGFLVVAASRRQVQLGVAAAVFGVVMGLEQPFHALSFGVSNNFPEMPGADFMRDYGSSTIGAALGLALFAMGALALRSER